MTGSWNINIHVGSNLPQKVATAMDRIGDTLLGAEYEPIAYLGSQVVNGTNHAILAEQTIITGRDTKNVVVMIFNEKPNEMEATLVGIERVVEGGLPFGGTNVDVHTELPEDAQTEWDNAFMTYVGAKVDPFAFLGTQVVNGVNYIFAATVAPVVPNAEAKVAIVTVNNLTKHVDFVDLLETKQISSLGYAFTWLKKPLGEWP